MDSLVRAKRVVRGSRRNDFVSLKSYHYFRPCANFAGILLSANIGEVARIKWRRWNRHRRAQKSHATAHKSRPGSSRSCETCYCAICSPEGSLGLVVLALPPLLRIRPAQAPNRGSYFTLPTAQMSYIPAQRAYNLTMQPLLARVRRPMGNRQRSTHDPRTPRLGMPFKRLLHEAFDSHTTSRYA